jgi:arsenite-transporting ATPase
VLLSDARTVFFGGKGGVGKTTLAAAAALSSSDAGARTLLVSTDPAHSTSDILECQLGPEPQRVEGDLWAMEIDPAREADRYVADVKARIADTTPPRLWAEVERQIDVARVSPGAEEAALFDRFTRILDDEATDHDRIVFDTAPTGQTLRLLSLPELMHAWIGGLIGRRKQVNIAARMWRTVAGEAAGSRGRDDDPVLRTLEERRSRFVRARSLLTDAVRTVFHFVLVPERLPILETERAVEALVKYSIPVGTVFVNRVLPTGAGDGFLAQRRERERVYLDRIAEAFPQLPLTRVPLWETDVVGTAALRRLAATVTPLN